MGMIEDTLGELRTSIAKAHDSLRKELSRIRTGRATPELLESIRIDYYGTPTPISQMASVAVPEPRLLTIKPYERGQIKAIESAIVQSPLGLNPQNDGELIRIPMPPLTEQRRKELAKVARSHLEDSKIAIRKARHDCRDMLASIESDGEASKDEVDRGSKAMEEIVKEGTAKADEIVASKEKDILQV
ncbi:MAG: ribosome recycling factor [Myxococcota bacterium]|nr:ribosome recycling factor [Myxococcota bacterium]